MKYFTIAELTASTTAKARGIDNTPGAAELANLENLVNFLLDPLRELYGKPITVSSGYRCARLNSAVGGSSTSEHRYGMAADISGGSKAENRKLFDLIRNNFVFGQLIDEKDYQWVHVSFNPGRMRNQVLRYNGSSYTVIADGADTPNPLTPGNTVNGVRVGNPTATSSSGTTSSGSGSASSQSYPYSLPVAYPAETTGAETSKKKLLLTAALCFSIAAAAAAAIIIYKKRHTK